MVHELRILDLFSGIGGFSLALKPIAKTVAYCDIENNCHVLLKKLFDQRQLDKAHIFNDVGTINKKDLEDLQPNMITAGFPCTDISSANPKGKGLKGDRSGLFREILRIIDCSKEIKVVLLENSPRIKDKGLSYVKRAMKSRGFTFRYSFFEALDVGAYHKRKRWFCLCYRCSIGDLQNFQIAKKFMHNKDWLNSNFHGRYALYCKSKTMRDIARLRCGMLGNSVVPYCVRLAWNLLLSQDSEYRKYHLPHQWPLKIELDDGKHKVTRMYWATPTFTTWHNYRSITKRGVSLLSNQVFYYIKTKTIIPKPECSNKYVCNPNFVEWLMGYPRDWTQCDDLYKKTLLQSRKP